MANCQLLLSDYDISEETGFMPPVAPLMRLRDDRFRQWEDLARDMPKLVEEKLLREKVHCLPNVEFSEATLMTEEEWWRAYVILTILSQGYVWEHGEKGLPEKLPRILAVPWAHVAEHVGLPPIVTYAAVVLHNWRLRDQQGSMEDTHNLVAIHTFTGTEDESWFYMVCAAVELAAVPAIKAIASAISNMAEHDDNKLIKNLGDITDSLKQMSVALDKMYERCTPEVFYVKIRPFESGTDNADAFPDGLVYEGVSCTPQKFGGASAAQSSAIPTIDIFLGAVHTGDGGEFLAKTRKHYMPPKHRRFLEDLSKQGSIREYITQSGNRDLAQAYNKAVKAFAEFRSSHVIMVTRYIINQKARSVNASLDDKGTGGTDLIPFLKKVRDETTALLIEV